MKAKMKTMIRTISLVLLFGGVALLAGCVAYGPGPYGYYDYYYYPDYDVYFYPAGGIYYWWEGGRWCTGHRLPSRFAIREDTRSHLRLPTREPWTEHHAERREAPAREFGGRPGGFDRR